MSAASPSWRWHRRKEHARKVPRQLRPNLDGPTRSAAASVGRREIFPSPRRRRRAAASHRACSSPAEKARGECSTPSTPSIWRTGGLAARPESCRRVANRGQNLQKWEERHAGVVVDVWAVRGRRTVGGTRGAAGGTRRGGGGCARRWACPRGWTRNVIRRSRPA
jgi:hypothetical protein